MRITLLIGFAALFSCSDVTAQVYFAENSGGSGFNSTGSNIGLAIGDFDNDGHEDIYVSRSADGNMLFKNNGNGTFTEMAAEAGVANANKSHTAVWGDLDNDGDLDLYVGHRLAANTYYVNNGNGTFSDQTEVAGLGNTDPPRSINMADVDGDGWLDIYVANLSAENALYRNNGDGSFSNWTFSSNVSDPLISMGSIFFDYDNDGDQDLYLTHDNNQANILYQNNGSGIFTDVSAASGTDYEGFGMGVDVGDINNDGWMDLYITNLYSNVLYLNNGDGTFSDISEFAGVQDPGMGWGTVFFDYDNDGWVDIYAVNNTYFSPLNNVLYRNNGDLTFTIVSENSPVHSPFGGYAGSTCDLNKDGKVDLLVTNYGSTDGNQIFMNLTQNAGNWLSIQPIGTLSNYSAIGTKIKVYADDWVLTDELNAGSGYSSQNSFLLHFGLGDHQVVDSIEVRWPSGTVEIYKQIFANQSFVIVEGRDLTTDVDDLVNTKANFNVFPNPATEQINLSWETITKKEQILTVINNMGQIVSKHVLSAGLLGYTLPVNDWPAGVYFLRVDSEAVKIVVSE